MVKSAVSVCIRTRPTANFAHKNLQIDDKLNSIDVHIPKDETQHINNQVEDWRFKFDNVLDNASQQTVYEACAEDIVESTLEGYNGTILAYGQTGAGKTFTMVGGHHSYEYRGVIPRSLTQIFRYVDGKPDKEYRLSVSYLEIYNECFYDLLDPTGGNITDVAVQEDDRGQTIVKGLTITPIHSEEDALNLLFTGDTNRAIAAHQMNKASSRSHCIFTIHVESRSKVESLEKIIHSKLNLVDLAGSERVKKTGSSGSTLNEAKYINKSLTFLEQVVIALSNRHRDHIPYRQSKLTNVLRDSLGGNAITRLIANIWCERAQLEETISTLRFATRMMNVSTDAVINIRMDPEMLLRKYESQIRELKLELVMHDTLANRMGVQYDEFTPEQKKELLDTIHRYVIGEIDDIEIVNIRQIRELFKQFRVYCQNFSVNNNQQNNLDNNNVLNKSSSNKSIQKSMSKNNISHNNNKNKMKNNLVGDIDDQGGFSIGEAPMGAAPSTNILPPSLSPSNKLKLPKTKNVPTSPTGSQKSEYTNSVIDTSRSDNNDNNNIIPSEDEAYPLFLEEIGNELKASLSENRNILKSKKKEFKKLSKKVNEIKETIDALSESLEHLREVQRNGIGLDDDDDDNDESAIINEEECALVEQLRKEKLNYQNIFAQRKALNTEIVYIKGLVESSKSSLARTFEKWYDEKYGHLYENNDNNNEEEMTINNDELDDAEQFDRLEMERVLKTNPESIHFYNAKKQARKKKPIQSIHHGRHRQQGAFY